MKRKSVDEFLSSPSKTRRLDYDLLQITKEEPRSLEGEVLPQQQHLFLSSTVETPKINGVGLSEERALVLYNPANTPFLRSPTSTDFTALLNSDLIPGLKDLLIYWPGNSKRVTIEDKLATGKITEASNDSMAVIPWVQPQFPLVSAAGASTTSLSQPVEAEAEMMDTDDASNTSNARNASESGEMAGGARGLQFWQQQHNFTQGLQFWQQQHFTPTQFLLGEYNHVSW